MPRLFPSCFALAAALLLVALPNAAWAAGLSADPSLPTSAIEQVVVHTQGAEAIVNVWPKRAGKVYVLPKPEGTTPCGVSVIPSAGMTRLDRETAPALVTARVASSKPRCTTFLDPELMEAPPLPIERPLTPSQEERLRSGLHWPEGIEGGSSSRVPCAEPEPSSTRVVDATDATLADTVKALGGALPAAFSAKKGSSYWVFPNLGNAVLRYRTVGAFTMPLVPESRGGSHETLVITLMGPTGMLPKEVGQLPMGGIFAPPPRLSVAEAEATFAEARYAAGADAIVSNVVGLYREHLSFDVCGVIGHVAATPTDVRTAVRARVRSLDALTFVERVAVPLSPGGMLTATAADGRLVPPSPSTCLLRTRATPPGAAVVLGAGAVRAKPDPVWLPAAPPPAVPLPPPVSEPRRDVMVSRGSLAMIRMVTVGDDTWVGSEAHGAPFGPTTVRVVALPDGATDIHLGPSADVAYRGTAPRGFQVERPPLCDTTWSCDTPRGPSEAPDPSPRPPPIAAPSTLRSPTWVGTLRREAPSRCDRRWLGESAPESELRVVGRDAVVATVRELAQPRATEDVPGLAPPKTSASRYAVVRGPEALVFRVRGPFTWPGAPHAEEGAQETVMIVATPSLAPQTTTLFPRGLLRAEPPRLYLAITKDATYMAGLLADQLATEGKPVHLERAATLDTNDRTEPNASVVEGLGLLSLPIPNRPSSFRIHRYRFRGVPDIGLSRTRAEELPRPREIATAFVSVEPHEGEPGDPRCPGKYGACYRPARSEGEWRVAFDESRPSPGASGVRLVEAPLGLVTGVPRDPSPLGVTAPSPAAEAPSSPRSPALSGPSPTPQPPGPRGCGCDTSQATRSRTEWLLGVMVVTALLARRRGKRLASP
ncbi:MAG: hypothetical protein U0183_15085 [Polyangiaceae bacterium]